MNLKEIGKVKTVIIILNKKKSLYPLTFLKFAILIIINFSTFLIFLNQNLGLRERSFNKLKSKDLQARSKYKLFADCLKYYIYP